MIIKTYRQLHNEYVEKCRDYGAMSKHEKESTPEGIKLAKRLKQLRADMDAIKDENNRKTPVYP